MTLTPDRLAREGEPVWTEPGPDETLDALRRHREQLGDLRDLAHAIRVIRTDPHLSALGEIAEDQAAGLLRVIIRVIGAISRDRARERDAARRRLNDELGIPNCDHLVPDPECPECSKAS